jgi:hypothetical protein
MSSRRAAAPTMSSSRPGSTPVKITSVPPVYTGSAQRWTRSSTAESTALRCGRIEVAPFRLDRSRLFFGRLETSPRPSRPYRSRRGEALPQRVQVGHDLVVPGEEAR